MSPHVPRWHSLSATTLTLERNKMENPGSCTTYCNLSPSPPLTDPGELYVHAHTDLNMECFSLYGYTHIHSVRADIHTDTTTATQIHNTHTPSASTHNGTGTQRSLSLKLRKIQCNCMGPCSHSGLAMPSSQSKGNITIRACESR